MKALVAFLFLLSISTCLAVDRDVFKFCNQSSFCTRCRTSEQDTYIVLPATISTNLYQLEVDLQNTANGEEFKLHLEAIKDSIFHLIINEKTPIRPRYVVEDSLKGTPEIQQFETVRISANEIVIEAGLHKAVIKTTPFGIDFYNQDRLFVAVNSKSLMRFEHQRMKPENPIPGEWEEEFGGTLDSKPLGPEAVSVDFVFPEGTVMFGIPEHCDSFVLKSTVGDDPYRLYTLDVPYYEVESRMALYGAIPVLYSHGPQGTAGVFWHNAAETWVDTSYSPAAAHFMSESGIIDFFILLGPTPNDAIKQYTDLTGNAPLPPIWTLGLHQSKWSYETQEKVLEIQSKYDEYNMALEAIWLDIDYTDGFRYFTWNYETFPNPKGMIANLTSRNRHLTFIIDPHIKTDDEYFLYSNMTVQGFFVKDREGNDFRGPCWPGESSYVDFFNPEARKFWGDQYLLENFADQDESTGIWNDMNEPAVFDIGEKTMPKDNIHFGGWEHRDVHNQYGHMNVRATHDGLLRRSNYRLRPFILTRSFFAGSQRYTAVWTGDNTASWAHMKSSISMCLSLSVAGVSFCGSDIGGFFGNPDGSLLERWFQVAAYQPFFRAHSSKESLDREPWLYHESTRLIIRDAAYERYTHSALWYTLFYEHERTGLPVMRPMLMNYPDDRNTYDMEFEYMLGDKLMVRPVTNPGEKEVNVFFPRRSDGQYDIWYNIRNYEKLTYQGTWNLQVDSYSIPVFQRGGAITPKRTVQRHAVELQQGDPLQLVVCLDANGTAAGALYLDDTKSLEYREGKYSYQVFEFKENVLSNRFLDDNERFEAKEIIESIIFAGLSNIPRSVTVKEGSRSKVAPVVEELNAIKATNIGLSANDLWSIQINY